MKIGIGSARTLQLILPLLMAAFAPASLLAQGPPSPVRVAPVVKETVENLALITGDLRAKRRSLVAAQEAGLALEVPVREGLTVRAGDLIVRLDGDRIEKERASLVALQKATGAERAQRLAELAQSERDVTSLESLETRGVTNPKELADARSAVTIAEAQLARTDATIEEIGARIALNEKRLADLRILAPFDGIIIDRQIEVGEWLAVGGIAVELVSTGEVEAWLNVPESMRGTLVRAMRTTTASGSRGPTVEVNVEAFEEKFTSSSPRLIPSIDETARTFPLVLPIPDPEGWLAPGMSASAYLPTGRGGEHLLVPKDAVLRRGTGPFIFVARALAPEGPPQAMPVPIRILFPTGDRFAVEAPGLQPGDLAIVEGNERLFPMMPVVPTAAGGPGGPGGAPAEGGAGR